MGDHGNPHGTVIMNKLGPIASDRYEDNLRLVVLSEDRDP